MALMTLEAPQRVPVGPGPVVAGFDGPPTDRATGWVVTGVLALVAAITRLVNLGTPTDGGTPVFDEKHYVPQAFQGLGNGGLENNPGYELVVHPPLAKQIIAISEGVFGYNAVGWRVPSAIFGVLVVVLLIRTVRRMTRSTLLGAVAGVLAICDGVLHLQSRMGMLDIFITFFVMAALACLVVDRDDVRARVARVVTEGRVGDTAYGPRLGVRWWRFGAGVMLGLACATKWSGIYYVVAFGLLGVTLDLAARRRAGVRQPWAGTAVRDVGPALWALVAIPVIVYVGSFWAWFASETGVDRWAVGQEIGRDGAWSFLPDALRSLWYYSAHVLSFHSSLVTPAGSPHPYESKPWTWPMGLRPMLYYFADSDGVQGCGEAKCVSATMLVGTPAMWWLAFPVLGWGLWRAVFHRDWRYTVALVGYAASYLPWFLNLDRQMYFFYATTMAPFLVMLLALVLGDVLRPAGASWRRRRLGLVIVGVYLGLVVVNYVWLWPILTGQAITEAQWQAQLWLPSWR